MSDQTALVAVDQLNPVELFEGDGLQAVLDALRLKALDFEADVSTPAGRKEIASQAYKVARSKTLLVDMGKKHTEEMRAKLKSMDGKKSEVITFCDALKSEVRLDLTEWEAEEKRKAEEEEQKKQDRYKARVKELNQYKLQDFDDFPDLDELFIWTDREYGAYLLERKAKYAAEQERLEKKRLEREAEEKRLAEERAEQDRIRKELEAKEAALKAEQERRDREQREREEAARKEREEIDRAKRELEEAKRLEEQRKRMEAEAAEREKKAAEEAAKAERERIEREKREAEEAKRLEAEAKARKEAMRPDREKLIAWANEFEKTPVLKLDSEEAHAVWSQALTDIIKVTTRVRKEAETL